MNNAALRRQIIDFHRELMEDVAANNVAKAEYEDQGADAEVEFAIVSTAAEVSEAVANRLSAMLKDTRKVPVTGNTFTTDRDADDN